MSRFVREKRFVLDFQTKSRSGRMVRFDSEEGPGNIFMWLSMEHWGALGSPGVLYMELKGDEESVFEDHKNISSRFRSAE